MQPESIAKFMIQKSQNAPNSKMIVDGFSRSVLNNLGQPIHSTTEGIRNFWRWFGDSRITKPAGRPVVMYHRTAAIFSSFDTRRGDLGSHFGTAEQANNMLGGTFRDGEYVIPVYLLVKNPLRLLDYGGFHADATAPQLRRMGLLSKEDAGRLERIGRDGTVAQRREANNEIKQVLWTAGFDSIEYKNAHEGRGFSYIVFGSKQVKSALSNSGSFNPVSEDLFDRSPAPAPKVGLAM